ncbi:MAG: 3-hydroxybenzoate 6-monooxygenase, partial [Alphaproteobacteria bacterium]|nr:3-hydroxybenzoate 6-monooxygenase [Alphaproteobacteria bacterium]
AVALTDALAAEEDVERAFRAYTKARYLRTARVQLTARMMGEIYHAEGVRRELRNHVLSTTDLREGMSWLYGGP